MIFLICNIMAQGMLPFLPDYAYSLKCIVQQWARLDFSIKIEIKNFEKSVLILKPVHQDIQDCSLDIKTGIETFKIAVLILRLVSRLSELQSWYRAWYQDFRDCSLDIETGIETSLFCNPLINTGIETFKTWIP